jgi:outer membrane protein
MRNIKTVVLTVLAFVFFFTTSAYCAEAVKIGIIDFQKVLTTSNMGKAAKAEIDQKGKAMDAELKKKGAEIEDTKQKLERESMVMSKDMRDKKERELQINIFDYKNLQQKYMTEFKSYEAQLIKGIQSSVIDIVEQIGKKDGYTMIVEKREAGVIYAKSSIDITDQVIATFNASSPKKTGKKG